jgi:hypothetical protein
LINKFNRNNEFLKKTKIIYNKNLILKLMRYLKNRNDFLNKEIKLESSNIKEYYSGSQLVKETLENQITWGGSLLGRLINSFIRKSKIYAKSLRINSVVSQVENELNQLIGDLVIEGENNKNKVEKLKVINLLTEVFNVVSSDASTDEKCTTLIGDGKSDEDGLLNDCIKSVDQIKKEYLPNKDELLKKLIDFRDALKKVEFEPNEGEEKEGEGEGEEGEGKDGEGGDDKGGGGEGSESSNIDPSKMSGGDLKKNPELNFFWQVTQIFKSLISLNATIQNNRVLIQGDNQPKPGANIQVGKEYNHTSKDGTKNDIMALSLTNVLAAGPDKKWLTKDDIKKDQINKDSTFVAFKDKSGKYSSASPQKSVYTKNISKKESFYFENESLPIYENVEVIRLEEAHSKAVWRKILNAAKTVNLPNLVKLLQELIDMSKEGEKLNKNVQIAIGKQVVQNAENVGKPLPFEALIKEKYGAISSRYSEVPKNISLLLRVMVGLKEDLGLVNTFGEAGKSIKKIIESYSQLKEIYPNLPKKEKVVEKDKEGQKKENYSKVLDYSRFRLFEEADADDVENEILELWYEYFEEGEEKEWKVDVKEVNELKDSVDEKVDDVFPIGSTGARDRIIRIVNLFGKAYRMYATDYIPSGRPEGRISLKTFREYTYIGGEKGAPDWGADKTPGLGPWAAIAVFDKWQDGIMGLLEKPKYRKILANARFLPPGVGQFGSGETKGRDSDRGYGAEGGDEIIKKIRAGRSLLDFMNDLLAGEGDFRKQRKKIIKEYFGGADAVDIDKETASEADRSSYLRTNTGEKGEKNTVSFENWSGNLKRASTIELKDFGNGGQFDNELIKIKGKTTSGDVKYLIIYFLGILSESGKKGLVFRFHFSKDGKKTPFVHKYLKDKIIATEIKLDSSIVNGTEEMQVGVLNLDDKNIRIGKNLKFKYAELIGKNQWSTTTEELELVISEISGLAKNTDGITWEAIKITQTAPFKEDIESAKRLSGKLKDFL